MDLRNRTGLFCGLKAALRLDAGEPGPDLGFPAVAAIDRQLRQNGGAWAEGLYVPADVPGPASAVGAEGGNPLAGEFGAVQKGSHRRGGELHQLGVPMKSRS